MIIGIVGKAGSGKDTVADFLVNNHQAFKMSFADPLKIFVQQVMGFTTQQLWGPSKHRLEPHPSGQVVRVCNRCAWFGQTVIKDPYARMGLCPRCGIASPREVPLTARLALQTLGTDWGRSLLPTIWSDAGISLATEVLAGSGAAAGVPHLPATKPEMIVFSDCRFLNEAEAIRDDGGGYIWRVEREGTKGAGGVGESHPSEAEQDSIEPDVTIANNSTLHGLKVAVASLIMDPPTWGGHIKVYATRE
jgi:hypothetical protein